MAKFKKPIVSAGVFLVGSDLGGGRHTEVLTEDRLHHWAKTHSKMKKNGVHTPSPWAHSKDALPVVMGNNGTLPRSDMNAGFVEDMFVEKDEKGIATLYGIFDIAGDPKDHTSPAGKVGTVVKETSIYARPKFVDGKGNSYDDAIMHVALVTHPIEPGQKNFELVADEGMTIAMSHCQGLLMSSDTTPFTQKSKGQNPGEEENDDAALAQAEDAPTGDLKAVLEYLRESGIDLPDDTTAENLNERLHLALRQKKKSEESDDEDDGSLTKPPKEAEEESAPLIMANTPEITAEVIMAHPAYKALEGKNQQLFNVMNAQAQSARGARINALVRSKRITKEYADTNLVPLLNGFQMSFGADGKEVASPLDMTLAALEALPAPVAPAAPGAPAFANPNLAQLGSFLMSSVAPDGSDIPGHPQHGFLTDGAVTEEEADKIADQLFA